MTDTAVFETSPGEWDIELVPPAMRKVGTIKRRGEGFVVQVLRSTSGHALASAPAVNLGPHGTLDAAMDAIARGTGGRCRFHQA
jgi:hypothetical protein